MTLLDISVPVAVGTPEWPGDTPFACGWNWRLREGASVNLSQFTMSPHVGTHADAPLHVRDGAAAADALPLASFSGPARVLSFAHVGALGTKPVERLLLRTGHSIADGKFPDAWPVIPLELVRALLSRGLTLLGVDAPSVDARESKDLPVHHCLFDGGANIIENLDLRAVHDGLYDLIALPVKLAGLDAAPLRAALRPLS